MEALRRIVIVGGGVAAERCAFELRARGFDGRLVMVSAEAWAPYDRTLLSKDLLKGTVALADLALSTPEDYEERAIELRLGVRAVGLDAGARRLLLEGDASLPYDRLVVATGGRPARPRALAAAKARVLRGADDARALREALERCAHLIVVGGGFIGGEVAAAAVARGVAVTMVEALAAPLAGALGPQVGARLAALHEARGVEVSCGVPVTAIHARPGGVTVALADGRSLAGDAVLVGAGMVPEVDWLAGSGVELDGGVVTDACCRTRVPGVLAAGDCARWHNPRYGRLMRVEHWDTARRHGVAAARAALGDEEPFAPLPFFWSYQHDVRLQWVGHAEGWDSVEVEDLDSPASFVARYHRNGRLVAACAAGQPRAVAQARRELEAAEAVAA